MSEPLVMQHPTLPSLRPVWNDDGHLVCWEASLVATSSQDEAALPSPVIPSGAQAKQPVRHHTRTMLSVAIDGGQP